MLIEHDFQSRPVIVIMLARINGRKMMSSCSFALPLHCLSLCSYVRSVSLLYLFFTRGTFSDVLLFVCVGVGCPVAGL
jgi:hypothetical protein